MMDRALSGEVLRFELRSEIDHTMDETILSRSGRNARTLIKDGALRLSVHTLAAGGSIGEHHADGPIAVQVLRGCMTFTANGKPYDLEEGDLISLPAGATHQVHSDQGASFLLTIAQPAKRTA